MNLAYWRYLLILSLLFIIWGEFFVSGGVLNQLAFNFAIFYPLGFLVGYRYPRENIRSAYIAAFSFNILSYLIASISGIPIESWTMVVVDFVSVGFFLKAGMIIGQRARSKEV
ncbi:MAG: hypothetical protein APF81_03700 [Desulfosporosinus sp. BRH_c37]|nr:MAG: hypothetical protein APF81_03700 [Desulfosporosinus sp. BRH_c37]